MIDVGHFYDIWHKDALGNRKQKTHFLIYFCIVINALLS